MKIDITNKKEEGEKNPPQNNRRYEVIRKH